MLVGVESLSARLSPLRVDTRPLEPAPLERVERLDSQVKRFILVSQDAERQSAVTTERQTEIERAIASTFSIQLGKRE